MSLERIHSSAIIKSGAQLANDVEIGPYAVIGAHVQIGVGTKVGSHAVIEGRTSIGERNLISAFASIGSRPQDLKYRGEDTALVIGNDNMFREYSNVSLGTEGGGGKTVIGNHNLFMVYTHVAHDCVVGSHVIAANAVGLAGHVEVGDGAVLGAMSAFHQFCRVGAYSMTAGGAMVSQDVIPYGMVHGDRAKINGLNVVGLRRLGISAEDLRALKDMYRLLFDENLTQDDAQARIKSEIAESKYRSAWLTFLAHGGRGLCR